MADTELAGLTEDTAPASDDWWYKANNAGTADRKVSTANLAAASSFSDLYVAKAMSVAGQFIGVAYVETSGTLTANTAYFVRVTIPRQMTFNRVGMNIAASSGNIDVGIYADDGTGLAPGNRTVSSGSTASPGTGRQLITIASTTLAQGIHWVGLAADNTTFSISRSTTSYTVWMHLAQSKASSFPLPASVSALSTNATCLGLWLEKA